MLRATTGSCDGDLSEKLHPRFNTPAIAIVLLAAIVYMMAVSGTFLWQWLCLEARRLLSTAESVPLSYDYVACSHTLKHSESPKVVVGHYQHCYHADPAHTAQHPLSLGYGNHGAPCHHELVVGKEARTPKKHN